MSHCKLYKWNREYNKEGFFQDYKVSEWLWLAVLLDHSELTHKKIKISKLNHCKLHEWNREYNKEGLLRDYKVSEWLLLAVLIDHKYFLR